MPICAAFTAVRLQEEKYLSSVSVLQVFFLSVFINPVTETTSCIHQHIADFIRIKNSTYQLHSTVWSKLPATNIYEGEKSIYESYVAY